MFTERIKKENWQAFFNNLSKRENQRYINVEVDGPSIGSQCCCRASKLLGISYDPKDEELYIFLENATHAILHPIEIFAVQKGLDVLSLGILDENHHKQLIKFNTGTNNFSEIH